MNWVCSFCGCENELTLGKCVECGSKYRIRQNSTIEIPLTRITDRAEFFSGSSKIDWFSQTPEIEPSGTKIFTTPIKVASMFAFVCMIIGTLMLLKVV
jgi:predicted ATP-dependent serine protease